MRGIDMRFGAVTVLQDVDFTIYPGEVHLLAGENGAGKSTLIKILGGIYKPTAGEITLDGTVIAPTSPLEANALGISVIHQELSLIPQMTVMENLGLGRYNTRWGFLSPKSMEDEAIRVLQSLSIDVSPYDDVQDIALSQQQLIEIGKATSINSRVIVMDEPSSALSERDAEILFSLIEKLKKSGCGIVYITHRMEEIQRLADRITVLRDGNLVSSGPASDYDARRLVKHMVGRELGDHYERSATQLGDEVLKLKDFSLSKRDGTRLFSQINLSLRAGEILGIGGLQGSGASALLAATFGAYGERPQGQVLLHGEEYRHLHPKRSTQKGLGFVTNDRKADGLVLPMSITHNITLASLKNYSKWGFPIQVKEDEAAMSSQQELSIRAASLDMPVQGLSGGNQQKVVLAKWMRIAPKVILMDEPTRGVDIGAKWEIYALLDALVAQGVGIILITSELSELMALSDRIAVMHRGEMVQEFRPSQYNPESILAAAMGQSNSESLTNMENHSQSKQPSAKERM